MNPREAYMEWKTVYLNQVHVHPGRKLQGFMPGNNAVAFIRDEPDKRSGDGVVHAVAFILLLVSLPIDLQNRDGITEQKRPSAQGRPRSLPSLAAVARSRGGAAGKGK